ncbi:MAG: hypothetical protein OEY89_11595 [Gammaproteobacteria bacterium]|nr:hypothetical protein [Gammaproteobacteria bacterium]
MKKYALLIIFSLCNSISHASNWELIPSRDAYWIKTRNPQQHELLIAHHQKLPQFLLILATNSTPPDKPMSVQVQIDYGPRETTQLIFLEQHKDKSIFRLKVPKADKVTYIERMIAGLKFTIYPQSETFDAITFSLLGFTKNLNELMIANDIGQLNHQWLLENNKTRELFCYLSSDLTIQAIHHRIKGTSLSEAIQSILPTGFPLLDNEREHIIKQVYNIKRNYLPDRPEHYKYKNFKTCISQNKTEH